MRNGLSKCLFKCVSEVIVITSGSMCEGFFHWVCVQIGQANEFKKVKCFIVLFIIKSCARVCVCLCLALAKV
jgi:hypothetical protein